MPFPIKTCVVCSEEFELRPDKPGFANRCPECTEAEQEESLAKNNLNAAATDDSEMNAARRKAIRDLLYRRES